MKSNFKGSYAKLLVFLAFLVLTGSAYLHGQFVCTPPPPGLTGWWAGDGNAIDTLGLHNGLAEGGLAYVPGLVGQAFSFNGGDAAVQFGPAGDFGTSDFTVEFWLNSTSSPHKGNAIVEKRASCNHGQFYGIRMEDNAHGRLVVETDDGQGNYVNITTQRAVTDASFHLIALVRQAGTTSVYVDGTLDSARTTPAVANVRNSAPLTAGHSVCDGLDGTQPFAGLLDEIQTFSRALSASEIKTIYNAGSAGECKNILLSPARLTFAPRYPRLVGVGGPFRPVTLTNNGTTDLTISKITSSLEFPRINGCGPTLAPGASCTISVGFNPKDKGRRTGTLSVTDDGLGSPHKVALTGNATFVDISTKSLVFADQGVGTTSSPKTITLTNTATSALTVNGIQLAGRNPKDFSQTNDCGSGLAPGASCSISVSFTPTVTGPRGVTAVISDDGGSSPQEICLLGNGT